MWGKELYRKKKTGEELCGTQWKGGGEGDKPKSIAGVRDRFKKQFGIPPRTRFHKNRRTLTEAENKVINKLGNAKKQREDYE